MNDEDLLPCPFCGNSVLHVNKRPLGLSYLVECCNCGASGPISSRQPVWAKYGKSGPLESEGAVCKRAIEKWNSNRRTAEVVKEWMDRKENTNEIN